MQVTATCPIAFYGCRYRSDKCDIFVFFIKTKKEVVLQVERREVVVLLIRHIIGGAKLLHTSLQ
jgi:hypothetical protein